MVLRATVAHMYGQGKALRRLDTHVQAQGPRVCQDPGGMLVAWQRGALLEIAGPCRSMYIPCYMPNIVHVHTILCGPLSRVSLAMAKVYSTHAASTHYTPAPMTSAPMTSTSLTYLPRHLAKTPPLAQQPLPCGLRRNLHRLLVPHGICGPVNPELLSIDAPKL